MKRLWKLGLVFTFAVIAAFAARSAAPTESVPYFPPPESQGGWRTLVTKNVAPSPQQKAAVLATTGLDTDKLVEAWKYVESLGRQQSLLVIRHGWIAAEWDYVGIGPVNSATKSLTGLALAKTIELSDAGQLPRLIGYDSLAFQFLPAAWSDTDPRKKLIKVRSLPTMCSGLEAMDMGLRDLNTALALPVVHPSETVDQYSSAGVMLEGMIIENATGQKLSRFFQRYFSDPIGAESVRSWDAFGAAGWAFMNTRDFARFGYLMLRNGAWNRGRGPEQFLRADLVAQCKEWPLLLRNVKDGSGNHSQWFTTNDPPSHFLHTWNGWWVNWSSNWSASMQPVWPLVPKDAFSMSGYGKDICLIIPSLDLVIAHQTARVNSLEQVLNSHPEFFSTLFSKVMAALVPLGGGQKTEVRDQRSEVKPQLAPNATAIVERWDTWERSLSAANSYVNPFQDVHVTATFAHSSGKTITVDGFHDGGSIWKIRFMPTELGRWTYATASSDSGLNGKTGTIDCVAPLKPYLHGPLRVRGYHFAQADGTPRFLISTRLSCVFAPPSVWPPLVAFLKTNRINRVLFMMPGVDSQKSRIHNQRYLFAERPASALGSGAAGPDYTRFNLEAFRGIDAFIDTLRKADILASPYFYYDPRREVMWKMTPEQDRAYLRYGMARFGAYANVMPVLGNEIELKTTDYKDRAFDLKSHAWANEMGAFLKSRAVFGQLVSVHNPSWHELATHPSYFSLLKEWPFASWTDFILKQVQVGSIGTASALTDTVPQPKTPTYNERAYARRNQLLIDLRRFDQPVIDEEPGYDMGGTASAWNSQTPDRMRRTIWTAAVAGAYTLWGSTATYETGDPLPQMKASTTPPYLRVLHDVMSSLPYAEMEPHNQCVTPGNVTLQGETWRTTFALAKPGEICLVYTLRGGTGTITLAPRRYNATRIDPRDGTQTPLGAVDGGAVDFSLPPDDWIILYQRTAQAGDINGAGLPDIIGSNGNDRQKEYPLKDEVWNNRIGNAPAPASATGEVFREFTFKYGASPGTHFAELDPGATFKFTGEHAWGATMPRHVSRPITLDLSHAVRAELSVEYWGGHIGTSGQRFQVNSNGWVDLPQPVGTLAEPQRFYRTLLGNNAVPIPLAHLRDGTNHIQFAAGPQIAYSFGFGFYWIYDFTVRVFYDANKPHPAGEITLPQPGATFGETLELEVRASGPNGPIARVEFMGDYDDFDWDGDGIWREWQFTTHHGALQHHLGTATNAPWRVTFDARWLPDQTLPLRVRARLIDARGIGYLTAPVENLTLKRESRSVRLFKSAHVPENFSARDGRASPKATFVVDADLARAKSARLLLSTWSANVDDNSVHEIRLNGQRLANRFGQFHNYSFNALQVPLGLLKEGTNEIELFSTFKGHALEINWPGPALLIEFTQ